MLARRMTTAAASSPTNTANQRNAVLAGFLGWTLDAFDFFILTLVIEDLAHAFFPGSPLEDVRPRIALAITLTLARSEEHTSELQSRGHLVCRLLLEKKKTTLFAYYVLLISHDS